MKRRRSRRLATGRTSVTADTLAFRIAECGMRREGVLLRSSEWIAVVYFVTLTLAAWLRPLPSARRWQVTSGSAAMVCVAMAIARAGGTLLRDSTPAVAILV